MFLNFLLITIPSFLVYFFTLSNSIYGGDAGDLVSAIITGGFAHPPGYPLYVLLGRLTNLLPLPFTTAGKITFISVISTVLSFYILYLIIKNISQNKIQFVFILITILSLSVNYLVWLYAIVPEVFPLNTLITLLILFFGIKLYQDGKKIYLFLIIFLFGLGISHHHTFILIIPSVLFLTLRIKKQLAIGKKELFLAGFIFFVSLLPLSYLIFASKSLPLVFWADASTFSGFKYLIFREGYGTFVPGQFITSSFDHRFLQLKNLLRFIADDFSMLGVIFLTAGFFSFVRSQFVKKEIKVAILSSIFLFGPFFFFYANFPLNESFDFGTIERFIIILYFLLTIIMSFGVKYFFDAINFLINQTTKFKLTKLVYLLTSITLLIYPAGLLIKNLKVISTLKNDFTAENLSYDILHNAKGKSAIIFLASDTILFNTQYFYFDNLKKYYPNKILIHASKLQEKYYLRSLKKNYPQLVVDLKKNQSVPTLAAANMDKFSIYSNFQYPLNTLKRAQWSWQGMLFKLVDDGYLAKQSSAEINSFWKSSKNIDLPLAKISKNFMWRNFFISDILRIYSIAHQNSAYNLMQTKDFSQAYFHLQQANFLNENDKDVLYLYSVYFQKKGDCQRAETYIISALKKNLEVFFVDQLKNIANSCYTDKTNIDRVKNEVNKLENKLKLPLNQI